MSDVPISYVWPYSFPFEEYDETDPRVSIIHAFIIFFRGKGSPLLASYHNDLNQSSIIFQWTLLSQLCPLEDLKMVLTDHPEDTLACLSAAVQIVTSINGIVNTQLKVRIANMDPYTNIKEIKAQSVGKFISIKGTVIRVSGIRSLVLKMAFKCLRCESIMQVTFVEGKYSPPMKCINTNCKSRLFNPIRQSATTEDLQTIRIQEIDTDNTNDPGSVPRSIECQCIGDLVDACIPGEIVHITGVVKSQSVISFINAKTNTNSLYLLYIQSNCIVSKKSTTDNSLQSVSFSTKDMKAIQFISQQHNLFNLILHSLCPSIYGQELVKAGLCLALAGGVTTTNKRGDIHLLIVGDPGLGKSQLLRSVLKLNNRSVFVCGNTTTGSGLTVTMAKDKTTGDQALEAGALILSDGGMCCIDEFDKMGSDQQVLLEAMEHQTISIAKAGIVCTLSSRVSIVAAANPVSGHYNRAKTVAENIKMPPGLLSRFDLIFLLLDNPDEYKDMLLSEHIMKNYSRAFRAMTGNTSGDMNVSLDTGNNFNNQTQASLPSQYSQRLLNDKESIAMKYRKGAAEVTDPIPAILLKKYFMYIRQTVKPKITKEAAQVLKEFYLTLRSQYSNDSCTPINTRQIESLIRLAQARAKIEMRETVTVSDAQEVVSIMKESLFDIVSDDMGFMNFERTTGMSKSKQVKTFINILNREAEHKGSSMFSIRDLIDIAHKTNMEIDDIHDFIDLLNQQAYLLKKGNQMYQLQTSYTQR